jgi:hypothetical protein
MAGANHYGEIRSEPELREIFRAIRREVDLAKSRPALTELYKRAGSLITLSNTPAWREDHGGHAAQLHTVGQEEFGETARSINRRAQEIGIRADYDETWGP